MDTYDENYRFYWNMMFRDIGNIIIVQEHCNKGGKIIETLKIQKRPLHDLSQRQSMVKSKILIILGPIRLEIARCYRK